VQVDIGSRIHQSLVESGQLDLVHVQADELRVKGRKMVVWMGLALMVSTRLWLAGTLSLTRDKTLADRLMQQVRACSLPLRALLVVTDGWSAYSGSIMRAFREKFKQTAGRGRACLRVWPDLCIATVILPHAAKTGDRGDAPLDSGTLGASHDAVASIARRTRFEHGLYRTLEWNHARATGCVDPQMSPCSIPSCRSRSGNVFAWGDLQFLLAAPRTLQIDSPGLSHHSSHGGRLDRSCLEHGGTLEVSNCASALVRTKATRTTKETS
jgi:hypothetical protein